MKLRKISIWLNSHRIEQNENQNDSNLILTHNPSRLDVLKGILNLRKTNACITLNNYMVHMTCRCGCRSLQHKTS